MGQRHNVTTSRRRVKPAKPGLAYRQLWRVVDGAIRDALAMHPDYLTPRGAASNTARRSIAKRVTGAAPEPAEAGYDASTPSVARTRSALGGTVLPSRCRP